MFVHIFTKLQKIVGDLHPHQVLHRVDLSSAIGVTYVMPVNLIGGFKTVIGRRICTAKTRAGLSQRALNPTSFQMGYWGSLDRNQMYCPCPMSCPSFRSETPNKSAHRCVCELRSLALL